MIHKKYYINYTNKKFKGGEEVKLGEVSKKVKSKKTSKKSLGKVSNNKFQGEVSNKKKKLERNNESYTIAKDLYPYSIFKLFFNFENNNTVEEIKDSKLGGSDAAALSGAMDLVGMSRATVFPDYITNPDSYDEIKEIIKSKWTPELLLTERNNACQLTSGSTISEPILMRAGISTVLGLRFIGQRVITHSLSNSTYNNKGAICERMANPDELIGEGECRFVTLVDGTDRPVKIKYNNLRPTVSIDLNILELMCGNGEAARHMISVIRGAGITISKYVATDFIESPVRRSLELGNDSEGNAIFSFDACDTIDAVERYGASSNTLLIISPPPGNFTNITREQLDAHAGPIGYADFYGCHDYIRQTRALEGAPNKFIIIVGELGAGDGTEGIYEYLMNNPHLELIYRNRILHEIFGIFGEFTKDVYIFRTR